ncbi:MAG: ferrochelatase [Burkholderiales bacterium PBB6]|uniref:Ferrochelatase n=1 Tax=Ideonella margarita TaxID=2984191 RepID=A0ABU9C2K4_9BURK|nr:MAG: ferrochelatase [Burkholderiales bacterium PBB6]
MAFRKEPQLPHEHPPRTGILLANLGTPDAPTAPALRRYLGEFLSDPRVIEIPALVWKVILHGIILRVRPAKSAAKYATVWMDGGSPLLVWTKRQAQLLQGYLGERGAQVVVRPAMRYGNPSIPEALDAMRAEGIERVLVMPAYPQYSGATTASTFDKVSEWGRKARRLPEFRFINEYHDDPAHIAALAASVRKHWAANGRGKMLVMSFHGMPERTLHLGDPYHCQCHKTARLLAEALELERGEYKVTFQSRFGKAKWLEPSTEPSLIALGQAGTPRVDVICPGFAADCLETLEEISQEAREAFLHAGGKEFHYIPCLNDSDEGMQALATVALRHLQGWPVSAEDNARLAGERRAAQERAKAMGAPR